MVGSVRHLHKVVAKNIKLLKHVIQAKLPPSLFRSAQVELQPLLARTRGHPIHPAALLKQSKGRWYTTHSTINAAVRRFATSAARSAGSGVKYDRSSFPKSRIGSAVNAFTGRAPFASTLRPNLTGGALGRTAGGYSTGAGRTGGARYFSHGPAAPATVVQNVSQAVRAFYLAGQKAQFDGTHPRTGEKRYKAVSALQEETGRKMRALPKATPGSYIDFSVNPTITALTPLNAVAGYSMSFDSQENNMHNLNTDGLLGGLSVDFSRALKDLAAVMNDLNRLSTLGDLPITYRTSSLRVHFPGCDAETVEKLCHEIGVQRGVVVQDEEFDAFIGTEIALLFPFAPSKEASEDGDGREYYEHLPQRHNSRKHHHLDWHEMMTPSEHSSASPAYSTQSDSGLEYEDLGPGDALEGEDESPWLAPSSSPSGYDSLLSSDEEPGLAGGCGYASRNDPLEYQGFEGIYRFIEQCDSATAAAAARERERERGRW